MTGKKWMIVLTDEQRDWLKDVASKTSLSGSDIVREMVDRTIKDNPRAFITSLAAAQYKMELAELEQKQVEIAEKQEELKRRMKQERVAV